MPQSSRFPLLPYLLALLLALIALGGLWYGLGKPVALPDAATPTHKLQCASYSPFAKDQSPFDQPFVLEPVTHGRNSWLEETLQCPETAPLPAAAWCSFQPTTASAMR